LQPFGKNVRKLQRGDFLTHTVVADLVLHRFQLFVLLEIIALIVTYDL